MRNSTLLRSGGSTLAAAALGNAFVKREDVAWLTQLKHPRMQISLPAFFVVGGLYYVCIGTIVHRSLVRGDQRAHRLALAVLAGNELWNLAFFGRHSTRAGFVGLLGFSIPVCLLQAALIRDRPAALIFSPYTAWVLCYDLPWTYQLWRLNP
ncbi:MAG TPA: TspO/MBR family protein [Nocardioidaceae bacterium]|nr:TspO/MBR family protein [Nocardioidaceae bacterium]